MEGERGFTACSTDEVDSALEQQQQHFSTAEQHPDSLLFFMLTSSLVWSSFGLITCVK